MEDQERLQQEQQQHEWPVGSLVVDPEESEEGVHAVRMVIGHREDGQCLTVYAAPPPWMNGNERGDHIYVCPECRLREAPREARTAAHAETRRLKRLVLPEHQVDLHHRSEHPSTRPVSPEEIDRLTEAARQACDAWRAAHPEDATTWEQAKK